MLLMTLWLTSVSIHPLLCFQTNCLVRLIKCSIENWQHFFLFMKIKIKCLNTSSNSSIKFYLMFPSAKRGWKIIKYINFISVTISLIFCLIFSLFFATFMFGYFCALLWKNEKKNCANICVTCWQTRSFMFFNAT